MNLRSAPVFRLSWGLVLALLLSACGRRSGPAAEADVRPGPDEFSVMTFNLCQYGLADRDGDGQKTEAKPQGEREAVVAVIAAAHPDVLAVQEIGNPSIFEEFRFALKQAGVDLPNVQYLQRGQSEKNLAVLTRFPIVSSEQLTDDQYSIGEAKVSVLRGFLHVEIEVNPQYRFHLLVAHLKSKVFHVLGQTEMRRNEARLLNNHVRRLLQSDPAANLAVVGDLNDTYQSAALHEALGERKRCLEELRPADGVGDVWTHYDAKDDEYGRIDYILVSPGLKPEVVESKTRVVRDRRNAAGSDHRPLVAVFKATNLTPDTATAPADHPPAQPVSTDE